MKKLIIFLVILLGLSLTVYYKTLADTINGPDAPEQPVLPQNANDVLEKEATQQIVSPQFYSEANRESFIKGVGVGSAVGLIVGGTIVWFFRKKDSKRQSSNSSYPTQES